MAHLQITASGQIIEGTKLLVSRIRGTSPREFVSADGRRVVDVTHVWHSPALPAIVTALIDNSALPAGFHIRERHDGVAMVGVGR